MVTQCHYQAPKTLHAAIITTQMVESCRLAAGAMMRGAQPAQVHMMDVPRLLEVDETPLTLNAVIKAFHAALAPPPPTLAAPATSVPKGPSKDPGGDRKQIKNLQEGLRNQPVNTDRSCSQMVDQTAHLAGLMERIEGLLRPTTTAPGTWSGSAGAWGLSSSPRIPECWGYATDATNHIPFLGSAPMVSKGRNLLDAAERALVVEAVGADRQSDARARTSSLTLVVRPQKRWRSAWMFRSRELRGPVCWTPAQK